MKLLIEKGWDIHSKAHQGRTPLQHARNRDRHDDDTLREKLRARYGNRALIELSFAIASARIPPTVKRVLGYAKSCRMVEIHP